ncbi:eukaryotic translation elongation factor 1 epsilon-1 [Cloeon dipterum]|uniref:eukaryotic translation elongation factor 1 epsilon-1 n=1 Tax=Cloeon dipterum TaxID=197152 RepID=UPI0032208936
MVLCDANVITNTCKFLNLNAPGDISFLPTCEVILKTKSKEVKGFASVLESIIKSQGNASQLVPSNPEELAQLRQWLEICITTVNFADSQSTALKELNERLAKVNFLVGNRISVADAVLYYTVYPVLARATMHEKEQFCHLSRWFSTVQHLPKLKAGHETIAFSRNPLYSN